MAVTLLFANPVAGRGRATGAMRRLDDELRFRGRKTMVCLSRPELLELPGETVQAVVVIGGDGTLRGVADRLGDVMPQVPLLIIPAGTANLMARHLNIPLDLRKDPEQAADLLDAGLTREVDLAVANGLTCLLMASAGFDAAVVHELSRRRSGPITRLDYVSPFVHVLSGYRAPTLRVTVDDQPIGPARRGYVNVANIPEYGAGFPIVPQAVSNDRQLDVGILPADSPLRTLAIMARASVGWHVGMPEARFVRGRRVEVHATDQPAAVQIDGDPAGFTPLRVELSPRRLRLIVGRR